MRFRTIFTSFSLLIAVTHPAFSQAGGGTLPTFSDEAIFKKGILANGMNWYFAENSSHKGLTDAALVQKMDSDIPLAQLDSIAADCFYGKGGITSSFSKFLSRHGIGAGKDGYYTVTKGSITYNFCNISSALPESVLDSALFGIFDLARIHAEQSGSTKSQAIVFAGDFDQKMILAKMKLISIIAHASNGDVPELKYTWDAQATPNEIIITREGALSKVEAVWKEPRTAKEHMRTVLPVISAKMADELGTLVRRRLESVMLVNGVNAWIDYTHTDCAAGPYDDEMRISVNCMTSDAPLVQDIMTREFSRLATWGVEPVEYGYARDINRYTWYKKANAQRVDNAVLREKAVSSFLYDASLASETDKMKFAYREMPLEQQTALFNDYIRQMLGRTVSVNDSLSRIPLLTPKEDIDKILNSFVPSSSLKLPKPAEEKVTGGSMFTYSNGINLIHKKMNTKGITYFCYAVKGGRHKTDVDELMKIEGIDEEIMNTYLAAEGIDLNVVFTHSDIRIEGSVVTEHLESLLKYLCAISAQDVNAEAFGPNVYKLLITTSEDEDKTMATTVAKYASALLRGGKWVAGKYDDEDVSDYFDMKGYTMTESLFKFDRTGRNKAIADMAAYALNDAIAEAFNTNGVHMRNWSSFPGYPPGHYHLLFGIHRYKIDAAAAYLTHLTEKEVEAKVREVLHKLATEPLSKEKLSIYKAMAKNANTGNSGMAEHVISLALDRYLDNKNFEAQYPSLVDGVNAEAIMKFYDSATTSANR